jgi:hypothetical protein
MLLTKIPAVEQVAIPLPFDDGEEKGKPMSKNSTFFFSSSISPYIFV